MSYRIALLVISAYLVIQSPKTFALDAKVDSTEVITVSGTRTDREINEIAANVTQISKSRIDAMASTNIRDILRYEPGVSVEGNGRFGLNSFNIRGINGDRILILLDNVPIADAFSFGPNLNAGRDFVDIDLIQQVDIVRGPASTLYGSDAIGGVVAFTTKSPKNLVGSDGAFNRIKAGYDSQSSQSNISAVHANIKGNWQWLVNLGARDGKEVESYYTDDDTIGDARRSTNPQQNQSRNALAKLIYAPNQAHQFSLTGDYLSSQAQTQLLSAQGGVARGVITLNSSGDDEQTRERLLFNYRFQPSATSLQRVSLDVFAQSSETTQVSQFLRAPASTPSQTNFRQRDSFFYQDTHGINAQFDQEFELGGAHYLIYGAQWQQTDSEGLREGFTRDTETGELLREFSSFPTRDFPISELTETALFVQDEIQLFDGKLLVSPGIRYDRFELRPERDSIFDNANPNVEITPFNDSRWSKKLGAVYQLSRNTSVWAQYAQGFRIPPMDDVNVGFTNFLGGYTSLANPALEPESVDSIEVGVRASTDNFDLGVSIYQNDYENFIESLAVKGFNPLTNLLEFQARNIEQVQISGLDLQISWYPGASFDVSTDWQINLASSYQDSENKRTGQALDSIMPGQTVLGIQYKTYDDPWRAELAVTHNQKAQAIADDSSLFRAPSHTLVDLLGHYQINGSTRINLAVYNLFDKKYWLASEVRGRSSIENLDRFSAPGRTVAANIVVTF